MTNLLEKVRKQQGGKMKAFTVKQLKNALIVLYSRKDEISNIAYRIAFDLLEEKLGDEKMDEFLEAHGI